MVRTGVTYNVIIIVTYVKKIVKEKFHFEIALRNVSYNVLNEIDYIHLLCFFCEVRKYALFKPNGFPDIAETVSLSISPFSDSNASTLNSIVS